MNTEEFLQKAISIHGDRFDYSESIYHYRNPVKIICKEHGAFYQRYDHHISPTRRSGCRKCYDDSLKLSHASVISRFQKIHGEKYDYSRVAYKGMQRKVEIVCKQHGSFITTPANHLSGGGCHECYRNSLKSNLNDFIKKAGIAHGTGRYDYSKSSYKGSNQYLTITCKEHGDFEKTPENHIHKTNPQGCPKCIEFSCFDRTATGYLYALLSKCGTFIKVGVSNNPRKRFQMLAKKTPFEFECLAIIEFKKGKDAEKLERAIHKQHERAGFTGFDGCSEWLMSTDNLIQSIEAMK